MRSRRWPWSGVISYSPPVSHARFLVWSSAYRALQLGPELWGHLLADPFDQQGHLVGDEADVTVRRGQDAKARAVADRHQEQVAAVHLDHGLVYRAGLEAPCGPLREADQAGRHGGEL